jgi:hypothetical protein
MKVKPATIRQKPKRATACEYLATPPGPAARRLQPDPGALIATEKDEAILVRLDGLEGFIAGALEAQSTQDFSLAGGFSPPPETSDSAK